MKFIDLQKVIKPPAGQKKTLPVLLISKLFLNMKHRAEKCVNFDDRKDTSGVTIRHHDNSAQFAN